MIETKNDLKQFLKTEKELYRTEDSISQKIIAVLKKEHKVYRWKYIKFLRKSEYYYFNRRKNIYYAVMYILYLRKKNKLGLKLGMDIKEYVFDEGLLVHHTQGIVINRDAKVGKNCVLHGANVIGNMGEDTKPPVIGDNVTLGIGAKVLGDIYIADGVKVGTGALVINSCNEEGALLVGVPAHVYRHEER